MRILVPHLSISSYTISKKLVLSVFSPMIEPFSVFSIFLYTKTFSFVEEASSWNLQGVENTGGGARPTISSFPGRFWSLQPRGAESCYFESSLSSVSVVFHTLKRLKWISYSRQCYASMVLPGFSCISYFQSFGLDDLWLQL